MTDYRGVFRTGSNIYNGAVFAKIINDFKLSTTFAQKAPSQMFDWVENWLRASGSWLKVWNELSRGNYAYKSRRGNTPPENMCDIAFEKAKSRGRKVTERVTSRRPTGSLKKEISQNSQESVCDRIYFLIKLYSLDLQNRVFSAGLFLWNLWSL